VIRLLLFLILAGALAGYSVWVYARSELPVRGRRGLATRRTVTLLILLGLLFDPRLPWGGGPAASGVRWALLDASLSMSAAGGAPWDAAVARAERLESEGWRIVPFGSGMVDVLPAEGPGAVGTRAAPVLARAVEAGADEVLVLSDLRFEDPVAVASTLAHAPGTVRFEALGAGIRNAGIGRFEVADHPETEDPVAAELELFGEGMGDSVSVEFREEGRLVSSQTLALPSPGLSASVSVQLPTPQGTERLRYTARLMGDGDEFPSDDEAVSYMNAGHEEGGLVLVSLRPDWEPRALLSVLADVSGLPASGYLRAGPDRFVPMGRAVDRTSPVDSARVSAAVLDAALVVIHGLEGRAGAWERGLVRGSSRLLAWPADAGAADILGMSLGPAQPGEWYASATIPPSPLASDLAGLPVQDLPPVGAVLSARGPSPDAPLLLQLGGTGPGVPAMVLDRRGGRRTAVVLASGFWRWAAREDAGLEAYRRLWSGVAGWLLARDVEAVAAEARPERWVFPRDGSVTWRIPGQADDSVLVEIASQGEPVSTLMLPSGAGVSSGRLPPGTYTYRAGAADDPVGEGRFDVEERTDEMAFRVAAFEGDEPGAVAGEDRGPTRGPPLRTSPWPYLLALGLLCVEWIGRRRAGLR
jgi:hypothetical protein